jgi:predicted small secreted protein
MGGVAMNPVIISRHFCRTTTTLFARVVFLSAVAVALAAGLTSCSTTYGLGKDIEKTGDKIQDAATR